MAEKVYKAGPGWVKQFDDGFIAGPFPDPSAAMAYQREVKKEEPKTIKESKADSSIGASK